MEADSRVPLAHPAAIQQYSGLKYRDEASITASATPNGLFHQGKTPKRPSHKGFEKSCLDSELPKVADAVIRASCAILFYLHVGGQYGRTL